MSDKNVTKEILSWVICIAVAVVIGLLIVNFGLQRTIVDGRSMYTTLDTGDNLWVEKLSKNFNKLKRGNIITVHVDDEEIDPLIKRIIALPGETIEIKGDDVYIDGEKLEEDYLTFSDNTSQNGEYDGLKVTLADDEYFVMGDNRGNSYDCRALGPVKKDAIIGRAFFRFYPFNKMGTI